MRKPAGRRHAGDSAIHGGVVAEARGNAELDKPLFAGVNVGGINRPSHGVREEPARMSDVPRILSQIEQGDPLAADKPLPLV